MKPVTHWRSIATTAVSFCLLSALAGAAVAAGCVQPERLWQASHVVNRSNWTERDSAGRQLVHENGTLHGAEISVALRCMDWSLQATLEQLDGSRSYDGETSSGAPALSSSRIRQQSGQLQAGWQFMPQWQIGARLSRLALWRDIASTASASGFPERFDWTVLSVGTQWTRVLGPGQLNLSAWLGKPLMSRMRIDLPGRDPTALQPGSTHSTELSAGWRAPLGANWHWQAQLRYRRTDMNQGAPGFITRDGTPVGVAFQPATSMVDRAALISISRDF